MLDEEEIRRRAYEIWEQEGRPEGRREKHWEQACREITEEGSVLQGQEQATSGASPNDTELKQKPASESYLRLETLSGFIGNVAALTAIVAMLAWLGYFSTQQRLAVFGHALSLSPDWWQSPAFVLDGIAVLYHFAYSKFDILHKAFVENLSGVDWVRILSLVALGTPMVWASIRLWVQVVTISPASKIRVSRLIQRYSRILRSCLAYARYLAPLGLLLLAFFAIGDVLGHISETSRTVARNQIQGLGCGVPVFELDAGRLPDDEKKSVLDFDRQSERRYFYLDSTDKAHFLYWIDKRVASDSRVPHAFSLPVQNGLSLPLIRRDRKANVASVAEGGCEHAPGSEH